MKTMQKSPKTVHFVDAGEDDEAFYIVQEWCRGGSVQEYIRNFPSYGENTVASIVRGALRGLYHMHEKGIIHADVKAGNIFLGDTSEDADVKLGDMGTAIVSNKKEVEVDSLVGTPWFMAPENLSHRYHTSSDVWSIGIMTYQLLCGKLPFNDRDNPLSPSMARIWKAILEEDPRMKGSKWDGVSEDAKDFVRLCLQKDYLLRPTAIECLSHPWLTKTDCSDRFKGVPLKCQPFKYDENAMTIVMDL
jgi:calcium-dependent protein kinase